MERNHVNYTHPFLSSIGFDFTRIISYIYFKALKELSLLCDSYFNYLFIKYILSNSMIYNLNNPQLIYGLKNVTIYHQVVLIKSTSEMIKSKVSLPKFHIYIFN